MFMITGIGVHDPPESVFTIDWNLCSRSNGIGVHDPPESAVTNHIWLRTEVTDALKRDGFYLLSRPGNQADGGL